MFRSGVFQDHYKRVFTMFSVQEKSVLDRAAQIIESKIEVAPSFISSKLTKDYCQFTLCHYEHEAFGVLFLNNNHRLLGSEVLFRGTIDSAAIYPREVLKEALKQNAAAVIFYHNHPSGTPTPSDADICITKRLKEALNLVDIRVVDHIVVGLESCVSFSETGLL